MLQYTMAERLRLKQHPQFTERWLQETIISNLALLDLGEVEIVTTEKIQPKAGRLDLVLHDEQLNRRYEVELMLGATDPSHIMRCIEYWDIERRRYPAYDHVAVLVAEDITSRFLNVMALLAGSIPLIAIQLVALRVDDKIALHFVHVLDQTTLRSDDAFEFGGGRGGDVVTTDRSYWEQRASTESLQKCDGLIGMLNDGTNVRHTLRYRKVKIDVIPEGDVDGRIWFVPKKTLLHVGGYTEDAVEWVRKFEEAGQPAALKHGNKAVRVGFDLPDVAEHQALLRDFFKAVVEPGDSSDSG